MQDDGEQRVVDLEPIRVVDEPQSLEPLHKEIHAGARRADHFRQRLLGDPRDGPYWFIVLAVPREPQELLDSAGIARTIVEYRRAEVIFTQGDPCEHVLYIQRGDVKLSVLSKAGREAIVAMLGPGEFFGEGCLAGQPIRMGNATATTDSTVLLVDKDQMVRLLHKQSAMSDRFIAHMLARNIRIEENLIDQLFNSSEKRLART